VDSRTFRGPLAPGYSDRSEGRAQQRITTAELDAQDGDATAAIERRLRKGVRRRRLGPAIRHRADREPPPDGAGTTTRTNFGRPGQEKRTFAPGIPAGRDAAARHSPPRRTRRCTGPRGCPATRPSTASRILAYTRARDASSSQALYAAPGRSTSALRIVGASSA
jgi:hypothetical protein